MKRSEQNSKQQKLNTLATNGYTAQGETVVTVVVVRRVDVATVEVQVVRVRARITNLRPIVAVRANVVQGTIVVNVATTHKRTRTVM